MKTHGNQAFLGESGRLPHSPDERNRSSSDNRGESSRRVVQRNVTLFCAISALAALVACGGGGGGGATGVVAPLVTASPATLPTSTPTPSRTPSSAPTATASPVPVTFTEYPVPTAGPGANNVADAISIASGPDAALWFTEPNNYMIGRITTSGSFTTFPLPPQTCWGIASGSDGALWFTVTSSDEIGRITTSGVRTEYAIPTPNGYATEIVSGPDGALWFTEQFTNKIGRITTAGVITEYPIPTPSSQPLSITSGPDGAIWFTEFLANKIGRISTTGGFTEYALSTGAFSNSTFPGNGLWFLPGGITSGPDGAIWFTEINASKIGRISTTGSVTEYATPTQSCSPNGITTGPDGAIWFTEGGCLKIGRTTTNGVMAEYPIPESPTSGPVSITLGADGALWFTDEDGGIGLGTNSNGAITLGNGAIWRLAPAATTGASALLRRH